MAGSYGSLQGSVAVGFRAGESQSRLECALRSGRQPHVDGYLRPYAQSVSGDDGHDRNPRHRGLSCDMGRHWNDARPRLSGRTNFRGRSSCSLGSSDCVRDFPHVLVRRLEFDDALDNDRRADRVTRDCRTGHSGSYQHGPAAGDRASRTRARHRCSPDRRSLR